METPSWVKFFDEHPHWNYGKRNSNFQNHVMERGTRNIVRLQPFHLTDGSIQMERYIMENGTSGRGDKPVESDVKMKYITAYENSDRKNKLFEKSVQKKYTTTHRTSGREGNSVENVKTSYVSSGREGTSVENVKTRNVKSYVSSGRENTSDKISGQIKCITENGTSGMEDNSVENSFQKGVTEESSSRVYNSTESRVSSRTITYDHRQGPVLHTTDSLCKKNLCSKQNRKLTYSVVAFFIVLLATIVAITLTLLLAKFNNRVVPVVNIATTIRPKNKMYGVQQTLSATTTSSTAKTTSMSTKSLISTTSSTSTITSTSSTATATIVPQSKQSQIQKPLPTLKFKQTGSTATTTTTTLEPTEIIIAMSSVNAHLKDNNVTMICHADDVTSWDLIVIVHGTSGTALPIVTLYSNGTSHIANELYKKKLKLNFQIKPNSVLLKITFTFVECGDEGNYGCTIFTKSKTSLANGLLQIIDMPEEPIFFLPTEVIEGKETREHISCTANVGYPEGFIVVQMKAKNSNIFTTLPTMIEYLRYGCQVTATAKLIGYIPTERANGTVIKCVVKNGRLLERNQEISSTATLTVLSADACLGVVNGSIRHPYSCNKFINCQNYTPSVEKCQDDFCFDPHSQQCGHTALHIETTSGFLNDGLASVKCRLLHRNGWHILTLRKQTSLAYDVVSVTPNGTVTWYDQNLKSRALADFAISKFEAELKLWIYVLKFMDEGPYVCSVEGKDKIADTSANLSIIGKPEKPELSLPFGVIENNVAQYPISCVVNAGYPPGNLVLEVKNENETDFREVKFSELNTRKQRCLTVMEGIYYVNGSSIGNGSEFKCTVQSNGTSSLYVSKRLYVIPENYCQFSLNKIEINKNTTVQGTASDGIETSRDVTTPLIDHPYDCMFYVQCSEGETLVKSCPDGTCFSNYTKQCDVSKPPQTDTVSKLHPCYPDPHEEYFPHPHMCNKYIRCANGKEELQHCRPGTLYLAGGQCTFDITKSYCYRRQDNQSTHRTIP